MNRQSFRKEKGEWGYLRYRKMISGILVTACFMLVLLFFILSRVVPDAHKNIMLVMSIVSVLPASNCLVTMITIFPYKDVEREEYDKMKAIAGDGLFDTGLHITANQLPTIPLEYVYVHPMGVAAFTKSTKINCRDSEEYMESMLRANGIDTQVKIFTDEKHFMERMHSLQTEKPICAAEADNKLLKTRSTLRAISL